MSIKFLLIFFSYNAALVFKFLQNVNCDKNVFYVFISFVIKKYVNSKLPCIIKNLHLKNILKIYINVINLLVKCISKIFTSTFQVKNV